MRSWFRVAYGGQVSRFAHSFAVTWSSPADGLATTLCGVAVFASRRYPDHRLIRFIPDETDKCPRCQARADAG